MLKLLSKANVLGMTLNCLLTIKNSLDKIIESQKRKVQNLKQEKFLMRVDNNKEGRNLIYSLRKNLNSDSYRIVTKYSGPRPVGTSQLSTSRANAESIRVYVESKLPVEMQKPYFYDSLSKQWVSSWSIKQAKAEEENAVAHERVNTKRVEDENKVLEAKLTLITARVQNSSKYGTFVKTVNSIATIN